ncbi:MAG: alpha/beta hydrolase [Vicinamibacterales bacterium]
MPHLTRLIPLWTVVVAVAVSTAISGRFDRPSDVFDVAVSGAGRPVILIPGLSTTGVVWDATVVALRDRHEVHVLTLAGFGGPEPVGEPFLPRVARGVIDYVKARDLRQPVIVGHSLGGFAAFAAAAEAPDLFGGVVAVDGVPFLPALADPAATADGQVAQAASIKALYASLTREQFLAQNRLALGSMITDPVNVEHAVGWAARADPGAVGVAVAEMLTTDLRPRVSAIRAPVLLIGALGAVPEAMRPAVRAGYEAQVARIPDATVVFAERARHFIMLDDPVFLHETLSAFLARTAGPVDRGR